MKEVYSEQYTSLIYVKLSLEVVIVEPLAGARKRQGTSVPRIYEYGYDRLDFGELAPDPFWGNDIRLNSLKCYNGYYTTCHVSNSSFIVTVYVSGYHDSPIRSEGNIDGDIFELKEKVDQTVYLTFDPPPDGYDPVSPG